MKEARMIFPANGAGNHFNDTIDMIVKSFGGATVIPGYGHWTNPNNMVVSEPIRIVDIAYLPSNTTDQMLFDIGMAYLKKAGEVELYIRYGNGHVQLAKERDEMNNGMCSDEDEPGFGGLLKAFSTLSNEDATAAERFTAFLLLEGHRNENGKVGV